MKNFLFILGLIILLCGGCKYFKKPKSVETITADTSTDAKTSDSAAYYSDSQAAVANDFNQPAVTAANAVTGTYYMIVGCFTVSANADKYAENLRAKGYDTQIIPGRDNFQMVSARTYNNYRESVSDIDKFRNEVTPNAWVYLQR